MNGGKEASDEDLEHLLLGDDFLDEERLQEQRAKERRLARKRRLEALEPTRSEKEEEEEQGPVPVVERIETRLESPQKPKTQAADPRRDRPRATRERLGWRRAQHRCKPANERALRGCACKRP